MHTCMQVYEYIHGVCVCVCVYMCVCVMGGTFQATAGFQEADIFQRAIKMVLRCILSCDFLTFQDSNFSLVPLMVCVGIKW